VSSIVSLVSKMFRLYHRLFSTHPFPNTRSSCIFTSTHLTTYSHLT